MHQARSVVVMVRTPVSTFTSGLTRVIARRSFVRFEHSGSHTSTSGRMLHGCRHGSRNLGLTCILHGNIRSFSSLQAAIPKMRHYVQNTKDLQTVEGILADSDIVGVDTEFTGFPVYDLKVELIQLATHRNIFAIDCALLPVDAISKCLSNLCGKEIVVHDTQADIKILRSFGLAPATVFDTQLAYAFVNVGSWISLADLSEEVLSVAVDKGEQNSEWRRRPLQPEQLNYAMEDVDNLLKLREYLLVRLKESGRHEWFRQESKARAVRDAKNSTIPDCGNAWTNVRRIHRLKDDLESLYVLKEVATWREALAQELDLASPLVAPDEALLQIAVQKPQTEQGLRSIKRLKVGIVRLHWPTLLAAVLRGVDGFNSHKKIKLEVPSHLLHSRSQKADTQILVHFLSSAVHAIAKEKSICADLLLDRESISKIAERYISSSSSGDIASHLGEFVNGWRSECMGNFVEAVQANLVVQKWSTNNGMVSISTGA